MYIQISWGSSKKKKVPRYGYIRVNEEFWDGVQESVFSLRSRSDFDITDSHLTTCLKWKGFKQGSIMADLNRRKRALLLENLAQKSQTRQLHLPLWVELGPFYPNGLIRVLLDPEESCRFPHSSGSSCQKGKRRPLHPRLLFPIRSLSQSPIQSRLRAESLEGGRRIEALFKSSLIHPHSRQLQVVSLQADK